MERIFDEKLTSLRTALLEMSELAKTMIAESVNALMDKNLSGLEKIQEQEMRLDRLQVEVDEMCCTFLALYQPTAFDLRLLLGIARISPEVERLGDKAVNIAQVAAKLRGLPPLSPSQKIPHMAQIASDMVHESIHAFVNLDVPRARVTIQRDEMLDTMRNEVTTELVEQMKRDSATIDTAIQLLLVARNLERIGDHATNIAEDAIFVAEGRDVRHRGETNTERPAARDLDASDK